MSSPSIRESTPAKIFNIKRLIIFASISLGIHILFVFLALPTMSKLGGQQDKQRIKKQNVGVVELNAAEQSRLPNLTPPPVDVPQYYDPNSLNSPNLDPSFFSANNNTAGNTPLLPPLTNNSGSITIDSGSTPPVVTPPQQSITSGSYEYTPQQPPIPPDPPSASTNTNTSNEEGRQRINFDRPQQITQTPDDWLNQRTRRARGDVATGSPTGMPQQTNNGQTTVTKDPIQAHRDRVVRQRVVEMMQNAESVIADSENTSNEEAREREVSWRVKVKVGEPTTIALAGAYPKEACMRKLQGTAVYGVVVDNSGRANNPYLIQSSGYPIFNQQARAQIQSHGFGNDTGQPKAYRVSVSFQYSPKICPAVAVVQPDNRDKPAAAPAQPSQTQQPTPEKTPATTRTPNTPAVNPTPVDPGKTPATTEATTTPPQNQQQQRNSSRRNRETTEVTTPVQPKPNSEATTPVQPKPASETTETTAPVRSKPRQETNSAPVAPRRAVQPQSKPNPETSRPARRNEENTSMRTKPRSQNSSPTPANVRKPSEVRPLGTAAPRKRQDNSRGNASEAPNPSNSGDE